MFKKKTLPLPNKPVYYPSGTFINTEKGFFYVASDTQRYRAITERVFDSWYPPRVVNTTEVAVQKYRIAAKLKFRNGSLIYNYSDGKIFLISDGKRRLITSPDTLPSLGASISDVIAVSQAEIDLHEEGEPIN